MAKTRREFTREAAALIESSESFFHTLKAEFVRQRRWATRNEARRDLFAYMEGYYDWQRIHSILGYITPEQAERDAS